MKQQQLEQRIKELFKYFGIYGYGNFDLNIEDVVELLKALYSDNYPTNLKKLYDGLEKQRMG